jgi:hypothetical protein
MYGFCESAGVQLPRATHPGVAQGDAAIRVYRQGRGMKAGTPRAYSSN